MDIVGNPVITRYEISMFISISISTITMLKLSRYLLFKL